MHQVIDIPTINETLCNFVDPFNEDKKITEGEIKGRQEALINSFIRGFEQVKHLLDDVIKSMTDYSKFKKIQPETHFDFVHVVLRNRSDDFLTKCNRDYVYYHPSKRGHPKFKSDQSNLTKWEKLFVELTHYTDFWHKNVEQEKTQKHLRKKQEQDLLFDNLKDSIKSSLKNVSLYIPMQPDTNFLAFYSERNPKNILRIKEKFLENMMLSLCLCGFDEGKFIDDFLYYSTIILPRDYFAVRAVINMFPGGYKPGKQSHRKLDEKKKEEEEYITEKLNNVETFLTAWQYVKSIIEEKTGYHKSWINQPLYSKEVIAFQVTDPITLLMNEYFSPYKHQLYEGRREDIFPAWQKEELKKAVGDSEANKFERTFTQHPIYEIIKSRLDFLLTDELQKRLDDLRKDILG